MAKLCLAQATAGDRVNLGPSLIRYRFCCNPKDKGLRLKCHLCGLREFDFRGSGHYPGPLLAPVQQSPFQCAACKLRPSLSYSRRTDRIKLGLFHTFDKGPGVLTICDPHAENKPHYSGGSEKIGSMQAAEYMMCHQMRTQAPDSGVCLGMWVSSACTTLCSMLIMQMWLV